MRRLPRATLHAWLTLAAIAPGLLGRAAQAHPLAPALLELRESPDGSVAALWKTSTLRPPGERLEPRLPESCRESQAPTTTAVAGAIVRRWSVSCASGLVGQTIAVDGLVTAGSDALLRVELADGSVHRAALRPAAPAFTVPPRARPLDVLRDYLRLGVEHILGGPDHLLFVFGLMLLASGAGHLLRTITAFTAGHSVTLSLAALGLAHASSRAIEVLIAASVLVLAVEIAQGPGERPTWIRRAPWLAAGGFGLLHGLGFAGALREVGLPQGEIPLALLSFNLGIEAGQVAFVLAALAGWLAIGHSGLLRRARASWLEHLPPYAMGGIAAYWCFARLADLLG